MACPQSGIPEDRVKVLAAITESDLRANLSFLSGDRLSSQTLGRRSTYQKMVKFSVWLIFAAGNLRKKRIIRTSSPIREERREHLRQVSSRDRRAQPRTDRPHRSLSSLLQRS